MEGKQEYTPVSVLYISRRRRRGSVEPRSQTWSEALRTARVHYGRCRAVHAELSALRARLIDQRPAVERLPVKSLQDSTVTRNLRSALTKRVLQMLEKLAKRRRGKYQTFWKQRSVWC